MLTSIHYGPLVCIHTLVLGLLALVTIAALGLAGNLPGAAAPASQDNAPFATLSLPNGRQQYN